MNAQGGVLDDLIRWLDGHGVASNVCHWGNVFDKPTFRQLVEQFKTENERSNS